MKKLLKFLPEFLRIRLIRSKISIPSFPPDFQVNIATTQEELEKAYSLLHGCYVGTKLMAPDPSGLRCNFFSFLPNTTTVVAKIGKDVVGTVSLIKDSAFGLPSDKDFQTENDQLRMDGHQLVEVSSLAIDPEFRKKGHVISLNLMKYLQHYTTHYMGCTTVTCVVHPRAKDFYSAFWGFTASKKVVKYKFVNDALGVQSFGNITDSVLEKLISSFPSSEKRNPIKFIFKPDPKLIYPERTESHHVDPIYTPELLKYFMSERTKAYKALSQTEIMTIFSAYSLFFDNLEELDFFRNITSTLYQNRLFRFPAKIDAVLTIDGVPMAFGSIMDLTPEGAFFATTQKLELLKPYLIEFEWCEIKFSFLITPRWHNRRSRNHQFVGYGMLYDSPQLGIARLLKQTHLSVTKRPNLKLAK